jgi:hypothetical protein
MVNAILDWQGLAEELEGLTPKQSNAFCEMQADCKIIQDRHADRIRLSADS